ncbi:MAG: helix-turn-helix transcriptional regulator [Legionellaceae bacterium]|nr:helix-turn-helix transcriptional regulator [Legionellaceae bacterium]
MGVVNTRNFSLDASECIRSFCRTVGDKHVVNFVHDITFGHGEISMLVTEPEMSSYYSENKIPIACTNDSGRMLAEGVYIDKVLAGYHPECAPLMALLRKVGDGKGFNYGRHAVHFSVRDQDCQHLYTVFFDLSEHDFLHYVMNNGALLQDMLESYNIFAKDMILEAKSADNRMVLPSFNDMLPAQQRVALESTEERVCVFHRNTHLPTYLSKQQGRCLSYLVQGKSSKEIAKIMDLSPRTVEYYLTLVRQQLGCRSSKDLILSYAEQFA